MQDVEGALSETAGRLSKLSKIWPSKESRSKFIPQRILCFVDANAHSADAIKISLQLSQEFDSPFSIRSIFDKELTKLADKDLVHMKSQIIEIVKENLKDTGLNKGVTFLEGDAIESIDKQLSTEYDILVLPVPYHSNLSDHPEAVAMSSLGEYLVTHITKPLFLVPEVEVKKEDIFEKIIIVVNDVSDIIQNQNYIRAISRNRSHLNFVFIYDEKDIENLAEASKGVVDSEMVKKRVRDKMEQYGKHTRDQFDKHIENVKYTVFSGDFAENIHKLIKEEDASLLVTILPENQKGYRFLLFQDLLRDRSIGIPVMVLHVSKKKKEKESDEEEIDEDEDQSTEDDEEEQTPDISDEEVDETSDDEGSKEENQELESRDDAEMDDNNKTEEE